MKTYNVHLGKAKSLWKSAIFSALLQQKTPYIYEAPYSFENTVKYMVSFQRQKTPFEVGGTGVTIAVLQLSRQAKTSKQQASDSGQ